jgi:hypothetical protein
MWLTGVGNGTTASTSEGGVYVGPYNSNFGLVVCADFFINSSLNTHWSANVTQGDGDLSLTRQGTMQTLAGGSADSARSLYNQAARLVELLMGAYSSNNRPLQREYAFAVWALFDSSVLDVVSASLSTAVSGHLTATASWASVVNPNLVIYTPDLTRGPSAPPQEFLQIRTPEGSVVVLWAVNIVAVFCLIAMLRRRLVRAGQ